MTKEERKQKRAQRRDKKLRRRMVMNLMDNKFKVGPEHITALYKFINGDDSKLRQYEVTAGRERDLEVRLKTICTMLTNVQEAPLVNAYLNGDNNAMSELLEFRQWRKNRKRETDSTSSQEVE